MKKTKFRRLFFRSACVHACPDMRYADRSGKGKKDVESIE